MVKSYVDSFAWVSFLSDFIRITILFDFLETEIAFSHFLIRKRTVLSMLKLSPCAAPSSLWPPGTWSRLQPSPESVVEDRSVNPNFKKNIFILVRINPSWF